MQPQDTTTTRRRTTVLCDTCGVCIEKYPSQVQPHNFCSKSCFGRWMRTRVGAANPRTQRTTKPCETCGATMEVWPCNTERQRFCSRSCAGAAQRKPKTCRECGNLYYYRSEDGSVVAGEQFCSRACYVAHRQHSPVLHSEETKRKLSVVKQGNPGLSGEANPMFRHGRTVRGQKSCPTCGKTFFAAAGRQACSPVCAEAIRLNSLAQFYATTEGATLKAAISERFAGKNNPRWRDGRAGGVYAPGWTFRLKRRIRKRDGGACRRCGVLPTNGRAHPVHHIDGEKVDHSPRNLVTLCPACHTFVHTHDIDAAAYLP